MNINNILTYFNALSVALHDLVALFGFMVFLVMANQLISGTMLSFSLITEPMLMPLDREEEDAENIYIDDFFWLHERGVDLLFIFIFLHMFRKLYLNVSSLEKDYCWKSGVFAFLVMQGTVFFGLVLCCTHLSDITLTMAKNAFRTFLLFVGKVEWFIFTDGTLNSDTVISLAYIHYVMAFFLAALGLYHGVDMHYDWQTNAVADGLKQELTWNDEALKNELGKSFEVLVLFWGCTLLLYSHTDPLSFEYFMWGDIGMSVDVSFYSVAPHWYFRPYMAWLVACPFHYLGIFGMVFFFLMFYFQLDIIGHTESDTNKMTKAIILPFLMSWGTTKYIVQWESIQTDVNLQWQLTFTVFCLAVLYASSYLPYGSFYHSIGGNSMTLVSYMYMFSYLGFNFMSYSWLYSTSKTDVTN